MRVAVVTFDGFNEIDSFLLSHIVNRARGAGAGPLAEITCPSPSVVSMNGVKVSAQRGLEEAASADAVIIGSGNRTREIADDQALMARLSLDPRRQLVGSQCSGALVLVDRGLVPGNAVCTDRRTRKHLEGRGVRVLDRSFFAEGNVATAGGCLSAQYLATWVLWRLLGREAAVRALEYVAPVDEIEACTSRALAVVGPFCEAR